MGPLPKRKHSKRRRDNRRNHDKLELPHLVACENCGEFRLAHRVCKNCGHYRGEQVVEIKKEE